MLALLIDAENLSQSHSETILAWACSHGDLGIVRIFGDFSCNRLPEWSQFARANSHEIIHQFNGGSGKNSTDIGLAINAMDLLYDRAVTGFCLASNDRDFVPLALRLRASGKAVHAICNKASDRYRSAFDQVLELQPAEHPILAAFRKIAEGREDMGLGEAGKLLRRHYPGLIPTTGKAPFQRALEAIPQLQLTGTAPRIRVRLRA